MKVVHDNLSIQLEIFPLVLQKIALLSKSRHRTWDFIRKLSTILHNVMLHVIIYTQPTDQKYLVKGT